MVMERKKIVMMCRYDWASVANRLSEAINRCTNWESRCVTGATHKYERVRDMLCTDENVEEIQELLNDCDILMYASSFADWLPEGVEEPKDKFRIVWHGGSDYRMNYNWFNRVVHPFYDMVFAHRDLVGLYEFARRLDVPFDVSSTKRTIFHPDEPSIIAHSPSSRAKKGTDQFLKAVDILKEEGFKVEPMLLENMTPEEVEQAKAKAHFFFDQIGGYDIPPAGRKGYGVSLVESASRGSVCMSWSDFSKTPITTVNSAEDIVAVVETFLEYDGLFEQRSKEHRMWVEREHSYEAVSEKFVSDVLEVMNREGELSKHVYRPMEGTWGR